MSKLNFMIRVAANDIAARKREKEKKERWQAQLKDWEKYKKPKNY